jgi:methionyl-tRNA synthetase
MSKSRGTFITAKSFIDSGLNPEWLRYYFAAKLNASLEDLDLNLQDFIARVNSDLLGKYINIASRSSGFLVKLFGGVIAPESLNHPLITLLKNASSELANLYEQREFGKAQRAIMELADQVNIFVDTNKPWELAKLLKADETPENFKRLQDVCSITLEAFRVLTIYLKPVLPELAKNVEAFLNIESLNWSSVHQSLTEKNIIQPYQHLMSLMDQPFIDILIDANKSTTPAAS